MPVKNIQTMPYVEFTRRQATLSEFKRLCDRTMRATMDGQQLSPRNSKHGYYYYKLFEDFLGWLVKVNNLMLMLMLTPFGYSRLWTRNQKGVVTDNH
jgi:hypothetical protein